MTYETLINILRQLAEDHVLINQWGYGNISDVQTPETGAPNYPYMFVNPQSVNIDAYGGEATLNIIAMDQALMGVDQEINAQSRMIALIQDILAQYRLNLSDQPVDINLPVFVQPFKERFKDNVIGATATITLRFSEPLQICFDPITPAPFESIILRTNRVYEIDFDGLPNAGDDFFYYNEASYDGGITWVNAGNVRGVFNSENVKAQFEFRNLIKFRDPVSYAPDRILRYRIRLTQFGPEGVIWESDIIETPWVSEDTIVEVIGTYVGPITAGYEYYFYVGEGYTPDPSLVPVGYLQPGSTLTITDIIEE